MRPLEYKKLKKNSLLTTHSRIAPLKNQIALLGGMGSSLRTTAVESKNLTLK